MIQFATMADMGAMHATCKTCGCDFEAAQLVNGQCEFCIKASEPVGPRTTWLLPPGQGPNGPARTPRPPRLADAVPHPLQTMLERSRIRKAWLVVIGGVILLIVGIVLVVVTWS